MKTTTLLSLTVPFIFTLQNGNCLAQTIAGEAHHSLAVEKIPAEINVSVYPNPSAGIFYLRMSQFEDLKMIEVTINDVLGEKIYPAVYSQISTSSNF